MTKTEFRDFQAEVTEWTDRNFPTAKPHMPLLGLQEEVGELAHAHLKGEQGIRHTKGEIYKMKKDAVGDIMVFLANYCNLNSLDLQDCVDQTWAQVKKRDWVSNPMAGDLVGSTVEDTQVFKDWNADEIIKQHVKQNLPEWKPFGLAHADETPIAGI